ncbi:Cell division protein FtsH [Fulvivirga imtechensis AK7]|uniref:ATP-dependent zinc metalloprotease FtsH n=1 Tax=Fulvivirga imtechensis AK7 TaxID=1237149 RepID=L8JI22_9BACT|nr:ATP-dependent zinc metalloprotease FtsH [Fulvivirga imtechensis]ELR68470.1 Cell division protein FtsH [Fulvivirga imtechensis AK7]
MATKNQQKPEIPGSAKGAWVILTLLVVFITIISLVRFFPSPKEITWQTFEKEMLERNAVEKIVVINKEIARVYIKAEFANDSVFSDDLKSPLGVNTGPHYSFNIGSVEAFERKLEEAQSDLPPYERVSVRYEEKRHWNELISWLIPLALLFFLFRLFTRVQGGGTGGTSIFSFGRSTARLQENENKSNITFDHVAGLEEAKQEVKEIVDFLKNPQHYTKLGAKIPKGVMIVGPPGTGKTLLAKAVAGEAQVPFFSLSGAEFIEMFVGVGASRVRDLFKRAKEKAPCIVFIDEIDAVGRTRGKNTFYSGANDERESTLDQLLTEMDGFGSNTGVIVLAATNRADILDPALLRPGRFDRHIYLELPNLSERKAIFTVHLKPLVLEENIDLDFLASQTPGFSGADIANICNEAALIAARKKKDRVEKQDFLDAMDRIIAGLEKKSKIISAEEKQIIAYHEAGHAIVSWLLPQIDPLMKVSIIPRGKSLGAAWYLPEERQIMRYSHFAERLAAALAGRAAEELVFGEVSSGAVDDLEKVTKEAYAIVAYFGFNKKIGNISFYDSTGRSESSFQKPYSEETAKMIDEEVRKLVDESYEQAKTVLSQHKKELVTIAELLLKKEVIYKEELEKILGVRNQEQELKLVVV